MAPTFADRVINAKPSATLAISGKAKKLQGEGKPVIALSAGEPDFDTWDVIKEGGIKAVQDGKTRYTPVHGTAAFRKAIAEKFKRENNISYDPETEIIASTGGKQILFNAIFAAVNPGDEVIIPAPYWVSYPSMVEFAAGKPVFVECDQKSGFKLSPEKLEKAITPKTKMVILNSPSNPTGAAYTEADLKALSDVFRKHSDIWIITDDIYEHLTYGGFKFKTLVEVAPDLKDRTLTMNGVSKAYALTGVRIGFAGGPKSWIDQMKKIQSHSTSNPSSISQEMAQAALQADQSQLENQKKLFERRRDFVVAKINEIDGLSCATPEGAFYVYPSCEGVIGKKTPEGKIIGNDEDFVNYLLDSEYVACVHGAAFGLSPHFRISYATSDKDLEEACKRIKRACAALKPS